MSPEHADTHFVRACAGNMNVNISPKPLDTEIYRKKAAPQIEPGTQTHILCEPAQSKCMVKVSQEPPDTEIYRKHAAAQIEPRTQAHILREPAQSKRMSRFHKSHLIRKFTGKRPRPRLSPERRHTFCASLRSRNACPHATRNIRRATLYGNLQEKCRGPDWPQNADTHFMRACSVKTHGQGFTRATRYGNLQETCRGPD